ncbi:MAG: MMPL family transporter [Planctomycetota bacterium]
MSVGEGGIRVGIGRYVDFFGRHLTWFWLLVVALTIVAVYGNARLRLDDQPRAVIETDDPDFDVLKQFFRDFGSDDNDCVMVLRGKDLFSPKGLVAIHAIADQVRESPGILSVQSLVDIVIFEQGKVPRRLLPPADSDLGRIALARKDALEHPLVKGQLLSDDASTMLFIIRLKGDSLAIATIEPIVARLREIGEKATEGTTLQVGITGIPALRAEIIQSLRANQLHSTILGVSMAILIAVLAFRRPVAVLMVVVPPIIGTIWTMGALGLVGEKINVINSILPTLVLVIGFTDSVHLVLDIRRSIAFGVPRRKAALDALKHLGIACFLTSFTTAVGFGSLATAEVRVIKRLGIACGAGAMITFVAVILLVPLMASSKLGDYITVPMRGRRNAVFTFWLENLAGVVSRNYRLISFVGPAISLVLAIPFFLLKPDNRLTETIPDSRDSYKILQHCDDALGGAMLMHVIVHWPEGLNATSPAVLEVLDAVQKRLGEQRLTANSLSLLNLLRSLPGGAQDPEAGARVLPILSKDLKDRLTGRFVREDSRLSVVSAHIRDVGVAAYEPVFAELQRQFAELEAKNPGFSIRLTGTTIVASRKLSQMIRDLAASLASAAVIIFVSMVITFRSLRLGLISIFPNLFPLAVTATLLYVTGRPLQLTSVIVFSISLGIAVDDTIHFLNRFQREMLIDGDPTEAVWRSYTAVGNAMVTTTVVLVMGFGVLMINEIPVTRLFAELSCTALIAALIGDLVILPALVICFVPHSKNVVGQAPLD